MLSPQENAKKIDWLTLRERSQTIPEFTELLLEAASKLPPEERSSAIVGVFDKISPVLNKNIVREYQILQSRGATPERALKLAIDVTLRARRKFLFRYLIGGEIPLYIKKYLNLIFSQKTEAKQDFVFNAVIEILHDQRTPVFYSDADAKWRLSETGFTPEFCEWALKTKMEHPDVVTARYFKRLQAGETRQKVIEDEIREYTFSLVLDRIKGQPVAVGVDFCYTAVIVLVCVGITVACTITTIVVEEVYKAKTEKALKALEFQAAENLSAAELEAARLLRDSPLSEQEINECIIAAYESNTPTFQTAYAVMLDCIRVNRNGRTTARNDETTMLRAKWARVEMNAAEGAIKAVLARQILNQYTEDAQAAKQTNVSGMVTAGIIGLGVLGVTLAL